MSSAEERIIVHVFAAPSFADAVAALRVQMADQCRANGGTLVDFIVDQGPPRTDPGDHAALVRMSRGEADALFVFRVPMRFNAPKSKDVLGRHLDGAPFRLFTRKALEEIGLLPELNKSLADAARIAGVLHRCGFDNLTIARRLTTEGFHPPGKRWSAALVAKVLERIEAQSGSAIGAESPA